jgi:DNA-binding Lrp family transcriptional regulator
MFYNNDMDTYSSPQIADALHVSVPRVLRAVARLGITPLGGGPTTRYTEVDAQRLLGELGAVRRADGFTREDVMVVTAMRRHVWGLRSAAVVAREARVSPTTAARSLTRLTHAGVVSKEKVRIVEGAVTDAQVYVLRREALRRAYPQLDAASRLAVLPHERTPLRPPTRLPLWLRHHFWNADSVALELPLHEQYVATRLLRSGDPDAMAWAASHLSADSIRGTSRVRGVGPQECAALESLAGAAS